MKSKCCLFFLLICCLFLTSCSADLNDSKDISDTSTLCVITNLEISDFENTTRGISSTKQIISGVLLKYHSEGLFSKNSLVSLDNPNAFYVEYLGENAKYYNGDGMEFNTVLYVPDIIKTTYKELGGKNPNSGNPFWLYMRVFLNLDLNTIRSSWNETIYLLVEQKDKELPYPSTINNNQENQNWIYNSRKIKSWKGYLYNAADKKYNIKVEKPIYKQDEGKEGKMQLFLPSMLTIVYVAGGGDYNDTIQAFYWYMKTYHNTDSTTIDKMVNDGTLESYLDSLEYIQPQEEDVKGTCNPVVSINIGNDDNDNTKMKFNCVYYYDGNVLQFEDGSLISDSERLYFANDRDGDGFVVFVPKSYIEVIEKDNDFKWNGNGGLWWNLLRTFNCYSENLKDGFTREFIKERVLSKRIINGKLVNIEDNA